MKKASLTLLAVVIILSAKAQKQDTTVYQSPCILAGDTTHYVNGDGQQIIFDSCPKFKHGTGDLVNYLSTHTRYKEIEGKGVTPAKVYVSFIIERDGSVSHAKIAGGLSNIRLRNEALRVVTSMPKWKPAMVNHKPVRMLHFVPVSFRRGQKK
jgi:hypothetical protein